MDESTHSHYRHNRLQQLRGFCYAVQSGSHSKASECPTLRQPTVSLRVQALECEFDTILFEPSAPTLSLTPDGEPCSNSPYRSRRRSMPCPGPSPSGTAADLNVEPQPSASP